VINHFTARVEALVKANGGNISPSASASSTSAIASNASVAEILDAIKKTAIEWPTDRLKKFPDLRFKYIEVWRQLKLMKFTALANLIFLVLFKNTSTG
jgi:hypothetical protein